MMNSISVGEIEILFNLAIEKMKRDGVSIIKPKNDEYWIITADEWDNFDKSPDPAVGSIKDDIEYLKKAIEDNVIDTYNDFDRLATVLRAVSEIEAPSNESE